jgi:hypothetical protein
MEADRLTRRPACLPQAYCLFSTFHMTTGTGTIPDSGNRIVLPNPSHGPVKALSSWRFL